MNNKGFTLVELLTVIVLLALVMIIMVPGFTNVAAGIRNQTFLNKQKTISGAMQTYANRHLIDEIKPAGSTCSGNSCCCQYDLNTFIIARGIYLPEDGDVIMNPYTNQKLTGCVRVSYNISTYRTEAKFAEDCGSFVPGSARCNSGDGAGVCTS